MYDKFSHLTDVMLGSVTRFTQKDIAQYISHIHRFQCVVLARSGFLYA